MFKKHTEDQYIEMLPGIRRKTLVFGEKTLLTEFLLKKGETVPIHQHPYEQTGYMVSGSVSFTIGDDIHSVGPGDSWCIPADMAHGVEVETDAVVVEVFSPVREDYLPETLQKP